MSKFPPTDVRFIKLGEKGRWEKSCIDEGTIRLGFRSNQHQESLTKQWALVRAHWLVERNGQEGEATKDLNEIRAFYELPNTTLWITIYNRLLYWCFAGESVEELPDGSRIRRTLGGWSCETLKGEKLHVANLDGRVSKVQGYRRTICAVEREEYLLRKIQGFQQPEVADAEAAFEVLCQRAAALIEGLWWRDFELLADLIFARAGWQRVAVLGKTEKDIDLDLLSPITNKRAFVQVKSEADFTALRQSIEAYRGNSVYDEMYFVVHTTSDDRVLGCAEAGVTVLGLRKLAELSINAGLMSWLIKKCG